ILEHRFVGQEGFRLVGARVLDGFAGSGALGLEALSRGAAKAVFLDKDPGHCAALRRAVTELDLADRAAVLRADLLAPAPPQDGPVDLVLLDPPYGTDLGRRGVQALAQAGWTRPGTIISLEDNAAIAEADLPGVQLVDQRRYGKAWISLCRV
ncbi:MAG: RsmD family RNA methyltransferase, partial [Rhodospirillaceae bacterium]